jgi:hypothetical protein
VYGGVEAIDLNSITEQNRTKCLLGAIYYKYGGNITANILSLRQVNASYSNTNDLWKIRQVNASYSNTNDLWKIRKALAIAGVLVIRKVPNELMPGEPEYIGEWLQALGVFRKGYYEFVGGEVYHYVMNGTGDLKVLAEEFARKQNELSILLESVNDKTSEWKLGSNENEFAYTLTGEEALLEKLFNVCEMGRSVNNYYNKKYKERKDRYIEICKMRSYRIVSHSNSSSNSQFAHVFPTHNSSNILRPNEAHIPSSSSSSLSNKEENKEQETHEHDDDTRSPSLQEGEKTKESDGSSSLIRMASSNFNNIFNKQYTARNCSQFDKSSNLPSSLPFPFHFFPAPKSNPSLNDSISFNPLSFSQFVHVFPTSYSSSSLRSDKPFISSLPNSSRPNEAHIPSSSSSLKSNKPSASLSFRKRR